MKNKKIASLLILLTLTLPTGCVFRTPQKVDVNEKKVETSYNNQNVQANKPNNNVSQDASKKVAYDSVEKAPSNQGTSQENLQMDRKITKNGNLTLLVDAIDGLESKVGEIAKASNGIINSSTMDDSGYKKSLFMEIKVPQDKFDEVLKNLSSLGKVQSTSSSVEDLTLQYIDTDKNLESLKTLEAKYKELLTKTNNMREILLIEEKLQSIRQQIDSTQGQLNYLKNQTDYSIINLTITDKNNSGSNPNESLLQRFINNLKAGFKNWGKTFVDISSLLILLLPVFIGLYLLYRIIKFFIKRRKNKVTTTSTYIATDNISKDNISKENDNIIKNTNESSKTNEKEEITVTKVDNTINNITKDTDPHSPDFGK